MICSHAFQNYMAWQGKCSEYDSIFIWLYIYKCIYNYMGYIKKNVYFLS